MNGKKEEAFTRMTLMKKQSVLESKHPDARTLGVNALNNYPPLPRLRGLPLKSQSDAHPEASTWKGLMHMHCSNSCCTSTSQVRSSGKPPPANMVDWLANSFPPWAAFWALMVGLLVVVLDKCPGV